MILFVNMVKYLSPEGLEKLEKELHFLKTVKRRETAEKLKKCAAYGDLSENSEYLEARKSQAFLEGRILELEELIKNARVVSKKSQTDWVQLGSFVLVSSQGKKEEFDIVGAEEASPIEGKISIDSPLGKAFLNKPKGAIVTVSTPQGEVKYKILKIT